MSRLLLFTLAFLAFSVGCRKDSDVTIDEEATRLLIGSWSTLVNMTISDNGITTLVTGAGTMTFSADRSFAGEYDSETVITFPDTSTTNIRFRGSEAGKWRVEDNHLVLHQVQVEITPLDEPSQSFLEEMPLFQEPVEARMVLLNLTEKQLQARLIENDGHLLTGERITAPNKAVGGNGVEAPDQIDHP